MSAHIIFITSGSGGVGKSTAARMIAQSLALAHYRTVLVDANPGQQSQRAYMGYTKALEDVVKLPDDLIAPTQGAAYATLPGPRYPQDPELVYLYNDLTVHTASVCDYIIVDMDRIDQPLLDDTMSMAGGMLKAFVTSFDTVQILFRAGQTGSQLDDAKQALAALTRLHPADQVRPVHERLGVIVDCPTSKPTWSEQKWQQFIDTTGTLLAIDVHSDQSRQLLNHHQSGWKHNAEPLWLMRTLAFIGADTSRWEQQQEKKRRWFSRA